MAELGSSGRQVGSNRTRRKQTLRLSIEAKLILQQHWRARGGVIWTCPRKEPRRAHSPVRISPVRGTSQKSSKSADFHTCESNMWSRQVLVLLVVYYKESTSVSHYHLDL